MCSQCPSRSYQHVAQILIALLILVAASGAVHVHQATAQTLRTDRQYSGIPGGLDSFGQGAPCAQIALDSAALKTGKFVALVAPSSQSDRYVAQVKPNVTVVIDSITKRVVYRNSNPQLEKVTCGFGPKSNIFVQAKVVDRSSSGRAARHYSLVLYDLEKQSRLLLDTWVPANSTWGFNPHGTVFLLASIDSNILGQNNYLTITLVNVENGRVQSNRYRRGATTYTFSPNGDVLALILVNGSSSGSTYTVLLYRVRDLRLVAQQLNVKDFDHLETRNDGHYIVRRSGKATKLSPLHN